MLGFSSTADDSYIQRWRGKTDVYGEWILFPQTVKAIEWARQARKKLPDYNQEARLLLNNKGKSYDTPTKGGNANRQIANAFGRLIERIQKHEDEGFVYRPFKMVRNTAATMIREIADGEIQGLFTCHGQPVQTDDLADVYATRHFGKLFDAIRKLQERLQPVFEAAGARKASRAVPIDRNFFVQLLVTGYTDGKTRPCCFVHRLPDGPAEL